MGLGRTAKLVTDPLNRVTPFWVGCGAVLEPGRHIMRPNHLGRREFITVLGGAAAAWPLPARAQQQAMTRVGIVTIQPRTAPMYAAFDQRLRELGYVEG